MVSVNIKEINLERVSGVKIKKFTKDEKVVIIRGKKEYIATLKEFTNGNILKYILRYVKGKDLTEESIYYLMESYLGKYTSLTHELLVYKFIGRPYGTITNTGKRYLKDLFIKYFYHLYPYKLVNRIYNNTTAISKDEIEQIVNKTIKRMFK